jgi:hypothetical protein
LAPEEKAWCITKILKYSFFRQVTKEDSERAVVNPTKDRARGRNGAD